MSDASPTLRVALVQAASSLDPADNRAALPGRLAAAAAAHGGTVDLVVLPEASARDFGEPGSEAAYAEPLDGPFTTALDEAARSVGTTAVAGLFETADDPARPFNTLAVRGGTGGGTGDGTPAAYRKIHLYDSFGQRESDRLTAGPAEPVVVDVAGWRVGLMTCYDLRFPELGRALVEAGAEVLVVPAAWLPGPRKADHWRTLARARAIEDVCFVVACGQPAPRYTGRSLVVDPWGDVVAEAGEGEEVLGAVLDRAVLAEARRTNPSLRNRRM